jgi:FkbM family methyltransferase
VIKHQDYWWPDDVGEDWRHTIKLMTAIDFAIAHAPGHRRAIQAGGNIGVWPCRLAPNFQVVETFEPDPVSRECLLANVQGCPPGRVIVHPTAVGAAPGSVRIKHRGLGSHRVLNIDENADHFARVDITPIDSLERDDVDLLQLDIEGFEWHALVGAQATIARCHPIIQIELRGFVEKYGHTDEDVRRMLVGWGYRQVSKQPGNDVVFLWSPR